MRWEVIIFSSKRSFLLSKRMIADFDNQGEDTMFENWSRASFILLTFNQKNTIATQLNWLVDTDLIW